MAMDYYQTYIVQETPDDNYYSFDKRHDDITEFNGISSEVTMEYFESGNIQQELPGKQRNQANARERDRTQKDNVVTSKRQEFEKPVFEQQYPMTNRVNSAFAALRSRIPTEPKDRKLSKIEILRLAGSYISHLANRLITGSDDQPCIQLLTDADNGTRNQVCTFCWSSIKKEKTPLTHSKSMNFITDNLNI